MYDVHLFWLLFVIILLCIIPIILLVSFLSQNIEIFFILPVIILLYGGGFFLLRAVLLKKINDLIKKNQKLISELQEKDKHIAIISQSLNKYRENDLKTYSFFGNFENFKKQIQNYYSLISKLISTLRQNTEVTDTSNFSNDMIDSQLDELAKTAEIISENIKKAFDISDNLSNSAKSAFEISEKVQVGVNTVTNALKESLNYSNLLFKQSQQISRILEILSDISARINILSINASIVSARAGIHGKPFEVVAREVRKLGEKTEKSLKQIEEEIYSIQKVINDVVEKIRHASEQTNAERNSLISVAGSLQGITLGIEVFRAVSKMARDKSLIQKEIMDNLYDNFKRLNKKMEGLFLYYKNIDGMALEIKEITDFNEKIKSIFSDNEM